MIFPSDENGDALRRMHEAGDDLTRSRDIDFTVVFPTENVAEEFARHFRKLGYAASVEFAETVKELPWDVVVVSRLSHGAFA